MFDEGMQEKKKGKEPLLLPLLYFTEEYSSIIRACDELKVGNDT